MLANIPCVLVLHLVMEQIFNQSLSVSYFNKIHSSISMILLGGPNQNMWIFHIPTYPPNFSNHLELLIILYPESFNKTIKCNHVVLTLKAEKVVYGIPKICQFFIFHIISPIFPNHSNNSQYYILKVPTTKN